MMVRNRMRNVRAGFTLVELLVVITIIGILASLITMAVFAALRRAKEAEIQQECSKIYGAFETFKQQFTAFPPDGNGGNKKVQRFVMKAFPRARGNSMPDVLDPSTGPAKSVVYWLSEVSTDERQPFRKGAGGFGGANQTEEFHKFYTFSESRIRNGMYYPTGYEPGTDPPFLYFMWDTYSMANFRGPDGMSFKPYDRGQSQNQSGGSRGGGNNKEYFAPESCQIIAAGLDKKLGTGGTCLLESAQQGGGNQFISEDDEDNLVSFSTQKIGDIRE